MRLRFTKMHGLGNDFVMIDAVSQKFNITPEKARKIANRHFGIGCDQVLVVEAPRSPDTDFRYRIFNHDGSEVENCGNGARCFAIFVRQRGLTAKHEIRVEAANGKMTLNINDSGDVTVNMGTPDLEPRNIPFVVNQQSTTYSLAINDSPLEISAVSMGNPHAVHIVKNVDAFPVETLGPKIEGHPHFPNRVNAGFMEIVSRKEIKLRVYERGVGETLACGTGACAAVVAGIIQNKLDSHVQVHLPGGMLSIAWDGAGKPVMMTGPATVVFHGQMKV